MPFNYVNKVPTAAELRAALTELNLEEALLRTVIRPLLGDKPDSQINPAATLQSLVCGISLVPVYFCIFFSSLPMIDSLLRTDSQRRGMESQSCALFDSNPS